MSTGRTNMPDNCEASGLADLLEAEVDDWTQNEAVTAKYRAFRISDEEGWASGMLFWKILILKVASHLGRLVVEAEEVKNVWFFRNGVVPLSLDLVLQEMLKEGHLQRPQDILPPSQSFLGWCLSSVGGAAQSISRGLLSSGQISDMQVAVTGSFVVMQHLQEKAEEVHKNLLATAGSCMASDMISTWSCFEALCGGNQEAALVLGYLTRKRDMSLIRVPGAQHIEGVKFAASPKKVAAITQLDGQILHLKHTAKALQQRRASLSQKVAESQKWVKASVKQGDKASALRQLRRARALSFSLDKCSDFQDRVEEVLALISEAEASQQVAAALRVGAHAIRGHGISVQQAEACVRELDEAVALHREEQMALATGLAPSADEESQLEEEFARLEAEIHVPLAASLSADIAPLPHRQEISSHSYPVGKVGHAMVVPHIGSESAELISATRTDADGMGRSAATESRPGSQEDNEERVQQRGDVSLNSLRVVQSLSPEDVNDLEALEHELASLHIQVSSPPEQKVSANAAPKSAIVGGGHRGVSDLDTTSDTFVQNVSGQYKDKPMAV